MSAKILNECLMFVFDMYCTSVISCMFSVHTTIHRVGFGIATAVHWVSLSDRKASTKEYFGNNDLTWKQILKEE